MDPATIITIITAAEQLIKIAVEQKALLASKDQASVDAALTSLRATSDGLHAAAQSI